MKTRPLLALLGSLLLITIPAEAQYSWEGTDNFNDNTLTVGSGQRWSVNQNGASGGTFVEINNRLEFQGQQNSTTPGFRLLGWNGGADVATAYTTPWVFSADLGLTHTTNGGFVQHGLEARGLPTTIGLGSFYLNVYRNDSVTQIGSVYTVYDGTSSPFTQLNTHALGSGNIALNARIAWDPDSDVFTASYSLDAGATFTTLATFDTTTWTASPSGGFYTNLVARASLGENVASGGMYFDNVAVSAIPEPSTYAALAGLGALGLALWRRRARA
jgi:hypothetical protein